jgi:hypothetical protein
MPLFAQHVSTGTGCGDADAGNAKITVALESVEIDFHGATLTPVIAELQNQDAAALIKQMRPTSRYRFRRCCGGSSGRTAAR